MSTFVHYEGITCFYVQPPCINNTGKATESINLWWCTFGFLLFKSAAPLAAVGSLACWMRERPCTCGWVASGTYCFVSSSLVVGLSTLCCHNIEHIWTVVHYQLCWYVLYSGQISQWLIIMLHWVIPLTGNNNKINDGDDDYDHDKKCMHEKWCAYCKHHAVICHSPLKDFIST